MENKTYTEILKNIGGKENILSQSIKGDEVVFLYKDHSLVNAIALHSIDEVKRTSLKSENQIILQLNSEEDSRNLHENIKSELADKQKKTKEGLLDRVFDFMANVFSPIIPALAGSGILKGILLLLNQFGLLTETNGLYILLTIASDAIFYFLPVILAFSTAQVLKVNPYIGVLISFTLLHPDFVSLFEQSASLEVFNIPVVLISYGSTVLPIILAIVMYSYLYRFLIQKVPESMRIIIVPLATLAIVVPITILVIGPLGFYGGELLAQFVSFLIERNGTLTGLIIGSLWMVIIMAGLNWAINPIMLNNISAYGFDYIRPFTFASNFSTLGVVLGVFLATKQKELKGFSGTNVLTIGISGIIEPTLYGILIKDKRYFIIQIIAGAIGGAYLGFNEVISNAFVFGSFITLPALVSEQPGNLIHGLIGIFLSMTISAFLSYVLTKRAEKRSLILKQEIE